MNRVFSTTTGNPSITPRASHQVSNCTQSHERKFALWQIDCMKAGILSTQLGYWKDKLIGYETLTFITDYPRPSQINYAGQNISFKLDENTSINLRTLAKELNVSLYTVLLSGYYLMLRSYSNQDDIVIGTLIANRHCSRVKKTSGLFVNTLAIRIQIGSEYLLKDFIRQVDGDIITSHLQQNLPFEKLVEEFVVAEDKSRHPIFQVMFGLQNFGTSVQSQTNEATDLLHLLEAYTGKSPHANFDFTTVMNKSECVLKGVLHYNTTLYTAETIFRFIETYIHTLSQLSSLAVDQTKKEHITIADLDYLGAEQYHRIIHTWNTTDKEYPADKTIHLIFEEQVVKTPDNKAIVYKEVQLTYRELNERANQLATCLIADYNIEPDTLITLCLERSEYMLIAILAVLKSGGAYVPIDPSYPDERIQYILEDTRTRLIITNEIFQKRLKGISCSGKKMQECLETRQFPNILSIDSQVLQNKVSLQAVTNPNTLTTSAHLAYVIYTSGTTGKPKGVMVEHRGLVNLNYALVNLFALGDDNEREVILQFSNYVFDASVEQIIIALLNGHVLLLIPNQLWLNKEMFMTYLFVNKVTHIHATPRFLEQHNFNEILSLRRLISGGDVLNKQSYDKISFNDSIMIVNKYGPTETSVTSTVKIVRNSDLNIGSPISNTKCYVLAKNLVPVPIGAIGELYIGGAGLARGYVNRPDLTTERFLENPFQTTAEKILGKNTRIYKTGDLVRWLPNGNLEYLGRNDLQVKIRGYRIELGEIENALSGYKGIKQSVALAKEHSTSRAFGNKYLAGYYVSDMKLDEGKILHYLESKLPDFMLPTVLVHLNKLPLTINGKLDRKALPDPAFTRRDKYIAPRNEIEEKACQIWAEVIGLNVDKVGTHDDFFRLGGDSIISIQLVSKLRKNLKLNVSVKDIFTYKSIAKLYENVFRKDMSTDSVSSLQTEQGILVGSVPLLPIQEWFFWRNLNTASHWNQSFLIKTARLDLGRLQNSLNELVQHHDCFRMRYKEDERSNNYEQYYDSFAELNSVAVLDIRTLGHQETSESLKTNIQENLTDWQENFNLSNGPLYSIGYINGYGDGSARIHFALHHLIVDAVSWRILSEDLRDLYYGKILGSKGSSYRQWIEIVKNYPCEHQEEQPYWNNILSDYDSGRLNNLIVSEYAAYITGIELSQEYTNLLLQESNRAYHSQINDLLLTALGYSLAEITGSNVNHIILEGHGREEINSNIDINRTLGWFTTFFPVRLEIADELGTSITSIKESLRTIPHKGLGFGPIRGYKSYALPRVKFNYLGQFGHKNSETKKDKNIWRIVGEDSGISVSPNNLDTYVINITGLIISGRLEFSILSKLEEKTVTKLARVFKQQLEVIINHTINQKRSYSSVSDIDYVIGKESLKAIQDTREINAIYLANNLQQGFIYHALSQGDVDDAYIVQTFWEYHCPVNINNLKQAWRYALDKFSSLRLRFDWQEDIVQIIDQESSLDWRYVDLSDKIITAKQEIIIKDTQKMDRLEVYDLAQGNLFRIYLMKQNWDLYSCIFSNHHAILDGWSLPTLLGYIHDTYLRLDHEELIFLQLDYSYEAAQHFIQEHQEDENAYWDEYISQAEERSDLGGLLLSCDVRLSEYKLILYPKDKTLAITGNLNRCLKLLSQEEGVTLNAILQYVWHKVLCVYGNSQQTIVGTTLSGRSLPVDDIEKSVGLYINTLPLIVDHRANKRVIESIQDIQSSIGDFNGRSNVNLAKLQPSAERLFDSLFVYDNYPNPTSIAQNAVNVKFIGSVEKLDYPLNILAYEAENEVIFQLQYAGELFSEDTIDLLLHLTSTLLEQLPSRVHQDEANLCYMNAQQYDKVIHTWNDTDKEYPADKTIHQLFEEQAAKMPENLATVYEETQLTYRELNERANQLAIYLIEEYNIEPDTLISLCLDRSEYMLIAILAVLKSGGAYVPIDPGYPDERIQYILKDTGATLLLSNTKHQKRLENIIYTANTSQKCQKAGQSYHSLPIDSQKFKDKLSTQAVTNPNTTTTSAHLAYVIYTSGTTGRPKGVMVEHRSLINLNYALVKRYALDANDREVILQFSNYVFDASVEQIIIGLLNGHVLLLIPNQLLLNKDKFLEYLFANNVTHIDSTPTFLEQHDFNELRSLKRIVTGGDLLSRKSYNKICINTNINIINAYGPTETSVTSTVKIITKDDVNIGIPLSNTRCYVLADNLVPLPIGAFGELYIGGAGLARGYLHRPDITAKSFVANPFQTEEERRLGKNTRLYKTGDLVRWLPNGDLEYKGRKDFQVKIRGYRIELGEIESALSNYEGIKQCVAMVKEHSDVTKESSGNKYIVGYYVSDSKLDEEALLYYLGSKLPDYMVPNILVHLNKVPLTMSGKFDKKALPDPEYTSPNNYAAPRNEVEEKARQIWAEVLGLHGDKVSIEDDFFRLGGDSIISIQLVSRLRKKLNLNVSVMDIFSYKSISRLYENVLRKQLSIDSVSSLHKERGTLVGAVPLLPIQKWFFWCKYVDPHYWNQSFLIKTPKLDFGKLQDSLDKLVQHHDCFRLRYKKNKRSNNYEQYYDAHAKSELVKVLDISTLRYRENSEAFQTNIQKLLTNWQANFDLTHGPMYNFGYIYGYQDGNARIHFALHHLIVDAVSWRILSNDLRDIYYGKILGTKGSSYRQWAEIVKNYPSKHQEEENYWNNILSNYNCSQLTNLIVSESTAHITGMELSQKYTSLLLHESNQAYSTQINDLLLTALGYTLSKITGSNVNHIVLEGHGREEIDSSIDINKTLGWFTSIYPVRIEIGDALGTCIRSIKESLRMIPHKGVGFGPIRGYNSNALPRVCFNYLGQLGQENSEIKKDKDIWQIVRENSGISMSPNNLDTNVVNLNGLIINSRLQFSIETKMDKETSAFLAREFKQQLEVVINHTINQQRNYLTVSDIDHIISKERLEALQDSREIKSIYLSNNLQQGFIYHALSQGDVDDAYITQMFWQYHSPINIDNLKRAWGYALDKFSSLRLRFDWQEDILQIIDTEGSLDWRYVDLCDEMIKAKQEIIIKDIQEKDRLERYDLARGNLLRIYLVKQNWDLYSCIFSNHHAILDGWSTPLLLGYIHDTYLRLNHKELVFLQPDYAYEAAQRFIQEHQEDEKAYWDRYISQVEERSDLGGLLLNSNKRLHEYKQILNPTDKILAITGNLFCHLKILSQREGVTLNAILQYVWHKVLHVFGNNQQTIVGTTLSGRSLPVNDIEKSVGLYINTLPLIVDHQLGIPVIKSIKDIQSSISEFNGKSNVNLAKLQKASERLFDSLFIFENYPNPTSVALDMVKLQFRGSVEKLDYPLNATGYEANDKLVFRLQYAGELFSEDIIMNLLDLTMTLLEQLPSSAHQAVTNLTYLNARQYDQIMLCWNATDREFPYKKTVHQLFEEQVAKTPDNVAVVYDKVRLTFSKLNKKANQLANYLIEKHNIESDMLITLCLDRSENMIIAILAVLKSGGAYVPIDPSYPNERIQYILEDTSTSLIITNEMLQERLKSISNSPNKAKEYLNERQPLNILSLDNRKFQEKLSLQAVTNPYSRTTSTHLAYVIYTSGTTGKPKGVMIEHRGVVNLNYALATRYALGDANEKEVILQLSNYVFDASVKQIILGLLNGHVLLLVPNQLWLDEKKFINYLLVNKVTHISATPRFLEKHDFNEILSLKRIVTGGDSLSKQTYDKIRFNHSSNIINVYGPTETSVISVVKILKNRDLHIGTPIFNTKCYVLADNLVPVPVGAIGELYIGGAGLARGYLNQSDLTAERFIVNPFQIEEEKRLGKNTRLYKTGDLVRWLPDGNLEYIGRKDLQVTIRGYRVELGEIESALLGYEGVKQCVAVAKEKYNVTSELSGNKYLVGYYVSDWKLDEEAILRYLGSKLPGYMLPTILVHLDKVPLTIHGKLDRKALPDPELTSHDNYVAPRNEIEAEACTIWAEVLGLHAEKVGVHDDFFRLGGDSIISIQLVGRLRKKLKLNVSVKDIFSHKSIAKLYEHVLRKELSTGSIETVSKLQTEHGMLVGTVPLLPIQKWFFRHNFSDPHHWNQSFLIRTPKLDLGKLQDSLDKLVIHHDCFRIRFKIHEKKNTYEQYYDNYAKLEPVTILNISTLGYAENSEGFKTNLQKRLTNWQASFNLEHGPMYSAGYIYGYKDGSARIHFALHHLIVDAVSWRILSEDLRDIYCGKILDDTSSSYRQWARIVKNYPSEHQKEQLYWKNILYDYDSNYLNNLIVSESTAHMTGIELSQEYTNLLLQESNQAYNTQINDLLLTALSYSLAEITGSNVNYIVLEGHGREEIDNNVDITRALGWFTTIYPVRLETGDTVGTSIRSIKEYLRTVPHKGLGFGPIQGYESNALPRISFNYLGRLGQENGEIKKVNDIWRIVGEDSGISMSPKNWVTNVININGLIIDERLEINIVSKLYEKISTNLVNVFEKQLEAVIFSTINSPRSYLTVSDIDNIISQERLNVLQELREINSIYLANNLQQGFIYHALSQGDVDDAYIVQKCWQYLCPINIINLKQAWGYAQDKFSSLRLRFDWQEDIVQIIDTEASLDWRYVDLSDEIITAKQEIIIKDIQENDRLERYDLAQGNVFRIYVIKQNWDLYSCIFSCHHAILDGWSVSILLGYIHDTYLSFGRKKPIFLQPDYAYEAAQHYIQEHYGDDKAYWDEYIAQLEERCDLGGLLINSDENLSEYKQILYPTDKILAITGNLYSSLKLLSQEEGITLYAMIQYVWHKVLHVYSNNQQTIVGTTLSGRNLPVDNIEKSVGLFINTLPLIVNHQADNLLIESIRDIQSNITDFNGKSNVNLAKLQTSAERLFDTLFVYENYPNPTSEPQDEVKLQFRGSVEKLDYPLNVTAYEANNELIFQLQYAGELFSADTMNLLLNSTNTLLEQVPSHAHQAVNNLSFINTEQYNQIVHCWNATDREYPADKMIHQLFEEQAAKTPANVVIVYNELQLTYRELNERANQLAAFLMEEYNIEPDSLITLCLDRSEHMIVSILAVLKSGGAYVPIDPSYPDERIQYILKDSGSSLLLTNEIHQERLKGIGYLDNTNEEYLEARPTINILSIDSREFHKKIALQVVCNPNYITKSTHLAYVIYTSGTTGKPKGVMIEHRGLVNLYFDLINRYALGAANNKEVILQFLNYVFDASVESIILGLLNGHTLLLIPDQLWLNREKFINYLFVNKVTHITGTPRFLEKHDFNEILSLKRIVTGGDSLSKQTYDKIRFNHSINIINVYGPTETSVISIVKILKNGDLHIGTPISNTTCYVLADNLVPVPVCAIGELYIGGIGVARGYLNCPKLTSERFLANPFQTESEILLGKNSRLYKTGDLVRWLPDGNLEYVGRKDLQVKVRGYRIELGEIESVLLGYKGIRQSVALAKEHNNAAGISSGNKYIVGYYVSDRKLEEEVILRYLRYKLPEYMVPKFLVPLDEVPLNLNGKLDRKALPDPEIVSRYNYLAPRDEIEKNICEVWAEALGLSADKVGTQDDFFKLGGDSIISIQMVSRLRKKLNLNVSVKDIFSHRCISRLYENVFRKELSIDNMSSLQTEQGILAGAVPLLPIQEWFFWSNYSAPNHWNQAFMIKTPRLDVGKLQDSLDKFVQHHDSFRLRYKKNEMGNTIEQYHDAYAKVEPIPVLDISTLGYRENNETFKTNLQKLLTNWQANFDLSHGPMYSAGYIYGYQDGSARIHFALHHLIVDAVSWRILSEDLRDIYYGKILGTKGSSYRQWAEIVKNYPSSHQEENLYWNNILADYDSSQLNNLILSESTAYTTGIELSREYTNLLLQDCNRVYHTQINDLLLTALGYSLAEITGSNVNHIVLEGHGREEIDSNIDITRTLGWFTTIYPVRLEVVDTLGSSIRSIKESLRTIPHKGLGFGPIRGYKSNTLPRVNFNYLGQLGQDNSEIQKDKDIWQVVGEDTGISMSPKNEDTNVININGLVLEGRLGFIIVSKLDIEATNKLARVFEGHLLVIINHCLNNTAMEYTISDFKDYEPYVVFNQESIGFNNLFMFPPGFGGAETYYRNIVPRLHNKRLILFNNYFLYLERKLGKHYTRHLTYEKLAEDYICYVKLIQPKGPYNFFGWSSGGVLAFEISKKLISRGDCVANLILLDSYFQIEKIDPKINNTSSLLDNNNFRYNACSDAVMLNTNVILFKATKVEEIDFYSNMYNTFEYELSREEIIEIRNIDKIYARKTKANNLDKILNERKIQVVPINFSHYSWVYNDEAIKEICVRLEKL